MKTMQPWLFQQLVDSAAIDERGINDRPKARRCPTCRAETIAAWEDGKLDTVHVDPVALTPLGELQAQFAGRRTFTHWGGTTGGLDLREARHIIRWPATNPHQPVRPEHRCSAPPLDHVPQPSRHDHDQPPF